MTAVAAIAIRLKLPQIASYIHPERIARCPQRVVRGRRTWHPPPMLVEPDLRLGGLSIWIEGRQFPDASDYWDGNWLMVRAVVEAPGAMVRCEGPILMATDFARFQQELCAAHVALRGEATLSSLEPELKVTLKVQRQGGVACDVEITPDHLNQFHRFALEGMDQSYLPSVIASCETILARYPVIGTP